MTPILSDQQTTAFKELAQVVFPGWKEQPSADNINIEQEPLARVLKSRPDLEAPLVSVLALFKNNADEFLRELSDADFSVLMTAISAAYVLDRQVKNALDYPGQQALTLDRGGFGCEELVLELMEQPKRFRQV